MNGCPNLDPRKHLRGITMTLYGCIGERFVERLSDCLVVSLVTYNGP